MGSRKLLPNIPSPKINRIRLLTEKLKFRKSPNSIRGCLTENSAIINTTIPIAEKAKQVRIKLEVQPPVFQAELPLDNASSSAVRNVARERKPMISNERVSSDLYSLSIMEDAIIPAIPIGTLTSKIVCQE